MRILILRPQFALTTTSREYPIMSRPMRYARIFSLLLDLADTDAEPELAGLLISPSF